jgi:hypothetical protein
MFWTRARGMRVFSAGSAILVLAFALSAFVQPDRALALIQLGTAWPDGRVKVCWRADAVTHTDHADSARVVRDTVENHWGRAANLNFTGWGTCNPGAEPNLPPGTIAIHWSDDDGNKGPWADVGYYTTKRTFVRLTRLGGAVDEATLRADTLHEFGHAIGFWHEQDHPQRGSQAAGVCTGTPKTDATVLTPFDVNSIMAWTYCYDTPHVLSPWDVIGVQNVYGTKPAGEIVGLGNRCLDIPNGSTAIGARMQVFTCNGTSNQVWKFAADNTLRANVGGQDRCVEVPNSTVSPSSGTVLQTDICNARDNQLFELKGMELRGAGNWCVDVPSANFATGQYVQLFECHNSTNQQWSIFNGRVIKSSTSGFCLEVPSGTATVNKLLRLATCTYGPAQQFAFTSAGEIRFGGLCVDARAGTPSLVLQLFDCKPAGADKRNQEWHLSGPVRGLGGQCLDIPNGRGYDGTPAQLFPCTGGTNQRWDVYFR